MRTNRARRQSRPNSAGFVYDSLETRCVLTGSHQIFVPLPEGLNLVQNEAFNATHDVVDGSGSSIAGWQSENPNNQIQILEFPGRGNVLHLDSSPGLDQVYQDVPTERGKRYLVSFDSRPSAAVYQQGHPVFTTQFDVFWNGTRIATIQPRYHWKTNTLEVIGGNGDFSRLTFSERIPGSDDQVGALIHHVRVVEAFEGNVNNGGFEQVSGLAQLGTGYSYANSSVPGWTASAPITKSPASLTLEPPRPHLKSQQGERLLNLNAHQGFRDSISQSLETEAGALYYIQFLAQGNAINELRIRWDNTMALAVRPDTRWESIGLLVRASSLQTNLTFIEGTEFNGDIRIDNIKIFRIDSPTVLRPTQANTAASYSFYAPYVEAEDTLKKRKL